MTNETQREKWRKAFEARYDPPSLSKHGIAPLIKYSDEDVQRDWHKYVDARWDAKQESEQIMKLAKFGAMVIGSTVLMYHASETITDAIACGLLVDDAHHGDTVYGISYAPNIEATIKELLK